MEVANNRNELSVSLVTHSLGYLKKIAGPRTVPIELGSKYTDEEWSQELMTLSEFIDRFVTQVSSSCGFVCSGYSIMFHRTAASF